jgi:hypothetical protein
MAFASTALGDESMRIVAHQQATNFFGEQEAKLRFDLVAPEAYEGRVQWRLMAAGRTLASRDEAVSLAPGKAHIVEFRHKLPPVKEGVVFPLELHIAIAAAKGDDPEAELQTSLYLFAANPFADRKQWLESLQIQLFDPMEATSKALTALEIPYASLTNLETLSDLKSGVLIVGEGIVWGDYGELGKELLAAAHRGVSVICLAPAAGELHLPFDSPGDAAPARISLRRTDVIRELDKRFSLVWSAERAIELRDLTIAAEKDAIVGKATEPGHGWPWVEVQYEKPQARLVWCGLGLIRSWDESPTPRYLLSRLLETLSPDDIKPKTP